MNLLHFNNIEEALNSLEKFGMVITGENEKDET